MNVQRIFEALEEDNDNSALGIICGELESQGYSIEIDGTPVTSDDFYEGRCPEIENKTGDLEFSMFMDDELEQRFAIEFVDFHEIVIKRVI